MNNDLVAFLTARLDEEADLARRLDGAGCCGEWTASGDTVDFCQVDLAGFHPTIAQHVALHDPARVLREVEAKRRVLSRHALSPAEGDPERPWDNRDDCQFDGGLWPCDDLLDLTLPYQDHPDFPERYKPNRGTEERSGTTRAPDRARNSGESQGKQEQSTEPQP
ncbi:DUF6221 family protein [Streptomyces sp. NPDC005708]|uniref:DUF6221 family protein n=1 Tax=Streptomyces sp. NPDC005708 TaxID=3154564 RepID=UPI0033DF5ED4